MIFNTHYARFAKYAYEFDIEVSEGSGRVSDLVLAIFGWGYVTFGDGELGFYSRDVRDKTSHGVIDHKYASPGRYTVRIYGAPTYIRFYAYYKEDQQYARSYLSLPLPSTLVFDTPPHTSEAFFSYFAYAPIAEIPANVFENFPDAESFNSCFAACTQLAITPEGMFQYCPNAKDFYWCFKEYEGEIQQGLFAGLQYAEDFRQCFYASKCTNAPGDMFSGCVSATNFMGCFAESAIETIGSELFKDCVNAENFAECFYNCTELSYIPSGLFSANSKATSFASCFAYCKGLTYIPSDLFPENAPIASFASCFHGCSNLTHAAPPLWEMFPDADGDGCFAGCVNLINYDTIPSSWK